MFNPFAEGTDADTSDVALVDQSKSGDRGALEKLVLRHQAWIYNIAIRMVVQPQDRCGVGVASRCLRRRDGLFAPCLWCREPSTRFACRIGGHPGSEVLIRLAPRNCP